MKTKDDYTKEEVQSFKDEIQSLITTYPNSYSRMITSKSRVYLKEFIDACTPLLQEPYYKISTKCYWVLHDLTQFPRCEYDGVELKYNVKVNTGYYKYCCSSCAQKAKETQLKIRETKCRLYGSETYNNPEKNRNTCLKKYGVTNPNKLSWVRDKIRRTCETKFGVDHNFKLEECREKRRQTWIQKYGTDNPKSTDVVQHKFEETCEHRYGVKNVSQVHSIRSRMRKKYLFNGMRFDSSWELAFYIWNKDNGVELKHEPERLEFVGSDGKTHFYFPDFKKDDVFIEIKGNQFFDKFGNVLSKYKDKFDYMKSIGVRILLYSDIKPYLEYVYNRYGRNFMKQFRRK